MSTQTTIRIETGTRQLLQEYARKRQTYDEFIKQLVAEHIECRKKGGLDAELSAPTRHTSLLCERDNQQESVPK
jgi:hypothetical protein